MYTVCTAVYTPVSGIIQQCSATTKGWAVLRDSRLDRGQQQPCRPVAAVRLRHLHPGSVAGLKMLGTEGEARALFAEELSAQHFADAARARQAGEAAAGTANSRTTRCYQLVRPSAHRWAVCTASPIN